MERGSTRRSTNGDRHGDRLGPKAESHRKLAFDVAELRVDRLEPNPAPGNLADRDGTVAEEDRHAIAKHRADAVDAPAPPERRVTPAERISMETFGDWIVSRSRHPS